MDVRKSEQEYRALVRAVSKRVREENRHILDRLASSRSTTKEITRFMKPTFEVVSITPQRAAAMLEGQTNVRLLRPSAVSAYAAAMADGDWEVTGEPIILNGTTLLNGFHRLNACIRAGVPFPVAIVRGIEPSTVKSMDSGLRRTIGDALRLSNIENANAVAATASVLVAWERGVLTSGGLREKISRSVIIAYAEEHRDELAEAHSYGQRLYRVVGGRLAVYSAVYTKLDPVLRNEFFEALISGADLRAGDARLALRNWLINRTGLRTNIPAYMGVAQMVKGWNAWLAGAVQWHLKRPVVGMEIPEIQVP